MTFQFKSFNPSMRLQTS